LLLIYSMEGDQSVKKKVLKASSKKNYGKNVNSMEIDLHLERR